MPFQPAEHKFRTAVRFGNLGEADRLLGELRREVELAWATAPEAERQSLAAQVLDLLKWARQNVLVKRSHTQRKLAQVQRDSAYQASAGARDRGPIGVGRRPIEFEG
jgi:hypothetical protein